MCTLAIYNPHMSIRSCARWTQTSWAYGKLYIRQWICIRHRIQTCAFIKRVLQVPENKFCKFSESVTSGVLNARSDFSFMLCSKLPYLNNYFNILYLSYGQLRTCKISLSQFNRFADHSWLFSVTRDLFTNASFLFCVLHISLSFCVSASVCVSSFSIFPCPCILSIHKLHFILNLKWNVIF